MGEKWEQWQTLFSWAPKSLQMMTATMKLKDACSLEEKQRRPFANKGPYNQSCGFSSSHVWMWDLDHKETWTLENWCFRTAVLEKTLENPLDSKESKSVNPKGNQSWIFIAGLMLKLKLQYFGHLIWRTDSFEKTLMLGKIGGRRRRG